MLKDKRLQPSCLSCLLMSETIDEHLFKVIIVIIQNDDGFIAHFVVAAAASPAPTTQLTNSPAVTSP